MKNLRKLQVSDNCAQNLVSGVMLCLAQIPTYFHVNPETPVDSFVNQVNYLKFTVDVTTSILQGIDYAAWQLMNATRDLVETGKFELKFSLPTELAETLLRDRYIDPYVTARFFRKCLRGPNGHHIKALYDNDKFLLSAAKYVLLRVKLQRDNLLNLESGTTNDLTSIAKDIFVIADEKKLWMKLDENSKKLDMLRDDIHRIGNGIAAPPASPKPRKSKRGVGGRGPQTEYMKRQITVFSRFLLKSSYDGNQSTIYRFALLCWKLNSTHWDKQTKATGQQRGYASYKRLAEAFLRFSPSPSK